MAPGSVILYYASSTFSNGSHFDWYRAQIEAANRATHREFIDSLLKYQLRASENKKSISLLTKAINRPKLRAPIRQPCWRAGRWKSLT